MTSVSKQFLDNLDSENTSTIIQRFLVHIHEERLNKLFYAVMKKEGSKYMLKQSTKRFDKECNDL